MTFAYKPELQLEKNQVITTKATCLISDPGYSFQIVYSILNMHSSNLAKTKKYCIILKTSRFISGSAFSIIEEENYKP